MKWALTITLLCCVWTRLASAMSPVRPVHVDMMGCGRSPEPDCKNVVQYDMQDDYGGFCLVCIDSMIRPEFCPRRVECPKPHAGPDCENVEEFKPSGPLCQPSCLICRDTVNKPNFGCPLPQYADYFIGGAHRPEPRCINDSQCAVDEKCCQRFGEKHCLKGIDTTPRQGNCPNPSFASKNPIICAMGYGLCQYDSECPGEEKCCENLNCGSKDCQTPSKENILNLACPEPKTWFPTKRSERRCNRDSQCRPDERCCSWFENHHCLKGLDTTPKSGICPVEPDERRGCAADYVGCEYDSECSGDQKCCRNSVCRYNECKSPPRMLYGLGGPRLCTREACGPEPSPHCQKVKEERPNGPGCDPVCRVCDDPPSTTAANFAQQKTCEERFVRSCPNGRSSSKQTSACRFRKRRFCN